MRNSSLWSDAVFEKEVIFHEFDFETSELDFEDSKSSIWKHTTSCDKGGFFFCYYLATSTTNWVQILTGLLFYACVDNGWDTPCKTGLWQLPIASNVFKATCCHYLPKVCFLGESICIHLVHLLKRPLPSKLRESYSQNGAWKINWVMTKRESSH